MSRIVLTPPDPAIGTDSMRAAEELLALGYERAAAFMARFALETVTMVRLGSMEDRGTRRSYREYINRRLRRGTKLNHDTRRRITHAHSELCEWLHADRDPSTTIPELVAEAEECRELIAMAPCKEELSEF